MTFTSFLLIVAGTGLLAKGYEALPGGPVPLHHIGRERAYHQRRNLGNALIVLGVALLIVAIALGSWT